MKVSVLIAAASTLLAGVSAAPAPKAGVIVPPTPIHPNENIFALMIDNRQDAFNGWFLTLVPNFTNGINMIVPSKEGYDRFGLSQENLYEVIPGTNHVLWAGFSPIIEKGQVQPFAFANDGPQVFTFSKGMSFTNDGKLQIDGKRKWALCHYTDKAGKDYGKVLSWLEHPFVDPFRHCDNVDIRRV